MTPGVPVSTVVNFTVGWMISEMNQSILFRTAITVSF